MTAPAVRRPDRRKSLIRLLHVAKRDRALDDEIYRDTLERATGKRSAAAMSEAELEKALKAMRAHGFRVKHSRTAPDPSRRPHRAREGQRALITALWIDLWQLGAVDDNSDKALDNFVSRQTGVAHAQWLAPGKANAVIEALKGWLEREGFRMPFVPEDENSGLLAKRELCRVIHRKLRIADADTDDLEADIRQIDKLTSGEAERLADLMGHRLRAVKGGRP
jgi:phage gp16-like protein